MEGVTGSIPVAPTIFFIFINRLRIFVIVRICKTEIRKHIGSKRMDFVGSKLAA